MNRWGILAASLAATYFTTTSRLQQRLDAAVMAAVFMAEVILIDLHVDHLQRLRMAAEVTRELLQAKIQRAFKAGRSMRDAILEAIQ